MNVYIMPDKMLGNTTSEGKRPLISKRIIKKIYNLLSDFPFNVPKNLYAFNNTGSNLKRMNK